MQLVADQIASQVASGDPTKTATASGGSATLSGLDMGEYLVLINGADATRVYQNTVVKLIPEPSGDTTYKLTTPVTLDAKKADINIDKTAKDEKTDPVEYTSTYKVGDVIEFETVVTIPDYPANATNKTFKVSDTATKGLTYNEDVAVSVVDGESTVIETVAGDAITSTNNAYTDGGNKGFQVVFNYDKLLALGCTPGQQVKFTYTSTVNSSSAIFDPDTNTAKVEFATNPYDADSNKTLDDSIDHITFGVDVLKVDSKNQSKALKGAEFKVFLDDGTGKAKGDALKDADGNEIVLVTGADGHAKSADNQGLGEGSYVLVETKAPSGYTLPTGTTAFPFTITDTVTVDGDTTIHTLASDADKDGRVELTVTNTPQPNLPVTGGAGSVAITVVGVLMMALAVFLVSRARKHA